MSRMPTVAYLGVYFGKVCQKSTPSTKMFVAEINSLVVLLYGDSKEAHFGHPLPSVHARNRGGISNPSKEYSDVVDVPLLRLNKNRIRSKPINNTNYGAVVFLVACPPAMLHMKWTGRVIIRCVPPRNHRGANYVLLRNCIVGNYMPMNPGALTDHHENTSLWCQIKILMQALGAQRTLLLNSGTSCPPPPPTHYPTPS